MKKMGGGEDKEEDSQEEVTYTIERDELRSPPKRSQKKLAKTKKAARKERKVAKKSWEKKEKANKKGSKKEGEEKQTSAGVEPEGETVEDAPTPSAMRSIKFTPSGKVTVIKPTHDHKHKRIFIEGSTEFSDDQ